MSKKCKICGQTTKELFDQQFNMTYYHCSGCQFIAMDDEEKVTFEEEKNEYDRHENTIENEGYVQMFKNFLSLAVLPYKNQGQLLDFGSGPEPVLAQLLKRDYNFEVDIYDLHYQPKKVYENKKYQVILSTEVVEHLDDPMSTFRLIYELLDDEGIFSFMTLYHENDDSKFMKWWYRRDITHISFFTPKTLAVIAEIIGFEMVYTDYKRHCTFVKKSASIAIGS